MRLRLPLALIGSAAVLLAACESDSTSSNETPTEGEVEINASSTTDFTYFNLETGQVVTPADPSTSTAWDLAFRRYEVRLNGGAAGPGDVAGFNLANNAGATSGEVLAFTPANQLPAFDAVDASAIPAPGSFLQESLEPNPLGWLAFGPGGPVANPSEVWKVQRTAGGGFALFHATGLTITGATPQTATLESVTFEYRYQPPAGTLGTAQSTTVTLASGNTAIDFSTGTAVAPTGCGWDVVAGADFTLNVNDACDVGTSPLDASQDFATVTDASNALQYGGFLAALSGAVPFSSALDDPEGPFLYNLAGDNRLSPTYNIYLVKVGTKVYKFELIGYYNQTGTGGYPTVRYALIP